MSKVLFIGDVHGKFAEYEDILWRCPHPTIQVGDMGLGFFFDGVLDDSEPSWQSAKNRFIRGNHDNPSVCKQSSHYIEDGTVEDDVMYIGGAFSIDKEFRVEGRSWWPDEELSYAELSDMIDKYAEVKPRVMVTHECPESVAEYMLIRDGRAKLNLLSRTRDAFDNMLKLHQPELWIFGHWHRSFDGFLPDTKTRVVCLNELEAREFDI